MFTHHAPIVLSRIRDFDRLFDELLSESMLDGRSSRLAAIETLQEILDKCENRQ